MWTDNDLIVLTGGVPAVIGSALDGYSDGSGEHANYIDANGHVHELYNGQFSSGKWTDNDLTAQANGVPAAFGSGLDGYMTNYGEHVNYIDANGHVHELYNGQFSSGKWTDNDLTEQANGVSAVAGSALDGYADGSGEHVNYIDANGHVHELYNGEFSPGKWTDNDLTAQAGGVPAAAGSGLDGYTTEYGEHVNFIDANGHVHELYNGQFSSGKWIDNDLIALTNGVPAVILRTLPLHAYTDGSGEHVNYIDGNGHVHELYNGQFSSGKWTDNDLTQAASGVPAANGSALDGYTDGSGEHVNFIDGNGHVHELYNGQFSSGKWIDTDLIAVTNGVPTPNGSALAAYSDGSGQHVYYIVDPPNLHVYELLN
jgi:hypothetical protein